MIIIKLEQQLVEGMMPAELVKLKRSNGNLPVEFVRNQENLSLGSGRLQASSDGGKLIAHWSSDGQRALILFINIGGSGHCMCWGLLGGTPSLTKRC